MVLRLLASVQLLQTQFRGNLQIYFDSLVMYLQFYLLLIYLSFILTQDHSATECRSLIDGG
jgi:hypothetical protein